MNIGITQRIDIIKTRKEVRDSLDQRLVEWVLSLGFCPVPIPNTLVSLDKSIDNQSVINRWASEVKIDAIILSGGNNIGDFQHRDITEKCFLKWAEERGIPVLGICRGMQVIGKYFGVDLIEVDGHVGSYHMLDKNNPNKNEFPELVNSYHNFSLQRCPDVCRVLARSQDGEIEAIAHKDLPWEAWMWHPEREVTFSEIELGRFMELMDNHEF